MQAILGTALLTAAILIAPTKAHAKHDAHSKPTVEVGIILFDGVEIIDFTGPYEVFGQAGFGVTTLTVDGKPVTTAMGLVVTPDRAFADAPNYDVLVVPGGDVREAQKNRAILDFIRAQSAPAKHVLSVCTGASIIAATGLLDGKQATTFHRALDRMRAQYPKVDVIRDVRWADSGKVITSAGLSSGIDAALHVVQRLRGEERALATALHLEYDWHPTGGYVRTKMADRYLPDLANVSWPKGTDFDQLIAVGDEQQWRVNYRMTSPALLAEVVALATAAIDDEGSWQRDKSGDTQWPTWHRDAEGHRVSLELASKAAEGGGELNFKLVVGSAAR
jgi:transcriptional regulator GlxA family with amidase domain